MEKFAQKIRDLDGFTGLASLYKMNPPLTTVSYDAVVDSNEYVIVSATHAFGVPETYIFPANEGGEVTSWGELEGSQRNVYSHDQVLSDIGYTVLPIAINGVN